MLKCEQISKELLDFKRSVERDSQSTNDEIQSLHARALHSIAAAKDSISTELCALSNRVTQSFQYAQAIESRVSSNTETLSTMQFLLAPEYRVLPQSVNTMSQALNDELSAVKASMERADESTQLLSSRIGDSVNGAIDSLTQKLLRYTADSQSTAEEIKSQLHDLRHSSETKFSESARSLNKLQAFLSIDDHGRENLTQRIEQAVSKASESLSLTIHTTITNMEARLDSSIETSRTRAEVSSRHRVEEFRQEFYSSMDTLRRESEAIKCSVRNDLQLCFNSQVE